MSSNLGFMFRKKKFNTKDKLEQTNLSRVLNLFDITTLGISCTLGVGIYILAGEVISKYSGPGIVLSFLIAGFATFIAGLCYAELGSKVPRSGSAYTYIYVTIGEFAAFIIGWDIILEYVIGVSSTASALSNYVDSLVGFRISSFLKTHLEMSTLGAGSFSSYPNILACAFVIMATCLLIIGAKESSHINNFACLLNITILTLIMLVGMFGANISNWYIDPKDIGTWNDIRTNQSLNCTSYKRCGSGGFLPFGFSGVLAGAAKCFYAFIGFDSISSTGEEVMNPKRNLPISIIVTLVVVSVLYCSTSAVLTLMIPYYMIDTNAPIPGAFEYVQIFWAKDLITVGAIASIIACLYGSIFAVPRIVYTMASDGLLFPFLSKIWPVTKTPLNSILVIGAFSAIMATILDLNQLIDLMSIGTLMAYTFVAICVLILRYRPTSEDYADDEPSSDQESGASNKVRMADEVSLHANSKDYIRDLLSSPSTKLCTHETSKVVNLMTLISTIDIIALCYLLSIIFHMDRQQHYHPVNLDNVEDINLTIFKLFNESLACFVLAIVLVCCMYVISRQPQNSQLDSFKIPFVSVMPLLSVLINVYLMMTLDAQAWIRFLIWFLLGLVLYFAFSAKHSLENKNSSTTPDLFNFELTTKKLKQTAASAQQNSKSKSDYENMDKCEIGGGVTNTASNISNEDLTTFNLTK